MNDHYLKNLRNQAIMLDRKRFSMIYHGRNCRTSFDSKLQISTSISIDKIKSFVEGYAVVDFEDIIAMLNGEM